MSMHILIDPTYNRIRLTKELATIFNQGDKTKPVPFKLKGKGTKIEMAPAGFTLNEDGDMTSRSAFQAQGLCTAIGIKAKVKYLVLQADNGFEIDITKNLAEPVKEA